MDRIRGLILVFLISHFLGDYYFQPKSLVDKKRESWKGVFCHFFVHLLLNILLSVITYGQNVLRISIVISVAHLLIDGVKKICNVKFENKKFPIYFADQFLHMLSIVIICCCCANGTNLKINQKITVFLSDFSVNASWLTEKVLAIVILLKPMAITIDLFLEKYKSEKTSSKTGDFTKSTEVDLDINTNNDSENVNSKILDAADDKNNDEKGLKNAGSTIGKLERLITYILASAGQFGTIGFVLAAKSITRYEKMTKEPAFGEYYLLGTLASILSAIILAVLF